jgi:hypothetical protein
MNGQELLDMIDGVQERDRVANPNYAKVGRFLRSIEKKIQLARYLYKFVQRLDFFTFEKWRDIEASKGRVEHLIELRGIRIHILDKDDYDFFINILLESFFSNLVAGIDFLCGVIDVFFEFSDPSKKPPYLFQIRQALNDKLPRHELTKLIATEYADNTTTWLHTLKELRNQLHHGNINIGKMTYESVFNDPLKGRASLILNEEYFGSSIREERREVSYFCGEVLEKTELFISQIYSILADDLKTRDCIPTYRLREM